MNRRVNEGGDVEMSCDQCVGERGEVGKEGKDRFNGAQDEVVRSIKRKKEVI